MPVITSRGKLSKASQIVYKHRKCPVTCVNNSKVDLLLTFRSQNMSNEHGFTINQHVKSFHVIIFFVLKYFCTREGHIKCFNNENFEYNVAYACILVCTWEGRRLDLMYLWSP